MLFEDGESGSDPFKASGFESAGSGLGPLLLPPLLAPLRGRGRSRSAVSQPGDQEEEVLTAKQPTFEFPPRASTPRSGPKPTTPLLSGSESEDHPKASAKERLPPLGAGIPRGTAPGGELLSKATSAFREIRSERGLPNIEIPSLEEYEIIAKPMNDPPPIVLSASSPERTSPSVHRPVVNRQRSKSSAVESPNLKSQENWSFSAARDYQFPPPGFSSDSDSGLPAFSPSVKTHSRASPTHASASTISSAHTSSRGSHQFTQSLDASIVPRRFAPPAGSLLTPPPIVRSRSAAPFGETSAEGVSPNSVGPMGVPKSLPHRPSMTRLASLAVMETVQTPSRPFTRHNQGRSGSVGDVDPPLPGLKDVLKVSMPARVTCISD